MINRRKVIFIPGLDLKSVTYYHRLFRTESKKQEKLNDYKIETLPIESNNLHYSSWKIYFNNNERQTITDYDFISWWDVLKKLFLKKRLGFLFLSFKALVIVFFSSSFRVMKSQKMLKIYYIYLKPYLLLMFLVVVFCGFFINAMMVKNIVVIVILLTLVLLCFLFNKNSFLKLIYLQMTATNFLGITSKWPHLLTPTVDIISKHVAEELSKNQYDEILICSHSMGAVVAIKTIANLINSNLDTSKLSFLSLGSSAPIVYLLSQSKKNPYVFHNELHCLIEHQIVWLDVTSLADGAAFALFEYPKGDKQYPIKISPQFHQMFDSADYKKLKKNIYKLHFQYLRSSHYKVNYDFFKLTTGNESLLNQIIEC